MCLLKRMRKRRNHIKKIGWVMDENSARREEKIQNEKFIGRICSIIGRDVIKRNKKTKCSCKYSIKKWGKTSKYVGATRGKRLKYGKQVNGWNMQIEWQHRTFYCGCRWVNLSLIYHKLSREVNARYQEVKIINTCTHAQTDKVHLKMTLDSRVYTCWFILK